MNELLGTTSGIEESRYTAKRQNPFKVFGLFFVVYLLVGSVASSVISSLPMTIYMYSNINLNELAENFLSGDYFDSIFALTEELMTNIPSWLLAVNLFATAGATAICMLYCKKFEKRGLSTMGFVKKGFVKEYLLGLCFGTVIFSAAVAIMVISGNAEIKFALKASDIPMIIIFFLGYILQGLSEEVACRGYLMVSMSYNTNVTTGVLVSSFVFAMLHLGNNGISLLAFINLFLFGFLAAVYYLRRGSIWGIAAVHTAWNFVQGNVFGISVSGMGKCESVLSTVFGDNSLFTGGAFGAEGGLPVTIILFAGIALLLLTKPKYDGYAYTN